MHFNFTLILPFDIDKRPNWLINRCMSLRLSVLIIEDSQYDTDLNIWHLRKAGYDIHYQRVENADEMKRALNEQPWDMILSDYSMPHFDVLTALEIYHESLLDIPFIVISGAIGEVKAVEMIKAGAHDYLLKDNMTRFHSVVQRELREAQLRKNLAEINGALAISEDRYRTMIKASPDGIFITNLQGIITEVSAAGLELYGTDTVDDIVGLPFSNFVPSFEIQSLTDIFNKTMRDGLAQNIELRFIKKDKSFLVTETNATILHDPEENPISIMMIIRDISERKNLEMQLVHSERMAGLGQMASGIAHEINQPLNTISMAVDNLLGEITEYENINHEYFRKKSEKVFDNITRIRNIIDHIRVFSRSHDDHILSGFNVNSSITNAVTMISEQFKYHGINLKLFLDDQLQDITGNTFKFEQVILNLLSNAKDALLEKEDTMKRSFDKSIEIKSSSDDNTILVEVTDNGVGIDSDQIKLILLPFYTTKDPRKGTGLGLSVSYQIIKEMNGSLEFSSEVAVGTKARIMLKTKN